MENSGHFYIYQGKDPEDLKKRKIFRDPQSFLSNRGPSTPYQLNFLNQSEHIVAKNRCAFGVMEKGGKYCVYLGTPSNRGKLIWSLGNADPDPKHHYFAVLEDTGSFCVYRGTDPNHNEGFAVRTNFIGKGDFCAVMGNGVLFSIYRGKEQAIGAKLASYVEKLNFSQSLERKQL